MYFDLMPKQSSVFSVAGSAYVQIGEKHQRKKSRRGRNIAGEILLVGGRIKSFIRLRPIKCAVLLYQRFMKAWYRISSKNDILDPWLLSH